MLAAPQPPADTDVRGTMMPISPDFSRQAVCVQGLLCDAVTFSEAKQRIISSIRSARRCNLVTPNAQFLRLIRSDPEFREAALASDLSVIDGAPLLWLARLLGIPVRERVCGSDLFDALQAERCEGFSAFFFGATDDVGERVRRRLGESRSAIQCAGTLSPGFGSVDSMSERAILDRINRSNPQLLIVSIGARKGVVWLSRNEHRLASPVICNLGATINFVAGNVKRAPVVIRRLGLEWLWRIKEEPALWTRYTLDLAALISILARAVLPCMLHRALHRPSARQLATAHMRHRQKGEDQILEFAGAWTRHNLQPVRAALASATSTAGRLVIDLNAVSFIDPTFLGQILLAYEYRRRMNRELVLFASERPVRRMLRLHGCSYLLAACQPGPRSGQTARRSEISADATETLA